MCFIDGLQTDSALQPIGRGEDGEGQQVLAAAGLAVHRLQDHLHLVVVLHRRAAGDNPGDFQLCRTVLDNWGVDLGEWGGGSAATPGEHLVAVRVAHGDEGRADLGGRVGVLAGAERARSAGAQPDHVSALHHVVKPNQGRGLHGRL